MCECVRLLSRLDNDIVKANVINKNNTVKSTCRISHVNSLTRHSLSMLQCAILNTGTVARDKAR